VSTDSRISPPHLAEAVLSRCLPPGAIKESVLGDLREMYQARVASQASGSSPDSRHDPGVTRRESHDLAYLWYWSQVPLVGGRYLLRRVFLRRMYRRSGSSVAGVPEDKAPHGVGLGGIWSDVRFAVRSLLRAPGFAIAVVLVLGIGVGAVSLMFSTFNSVVLRPLPFDDPDRLMWVWGMSERMPRNTISYADYVDFRDGTTAFESLAAAMFRRTRVLTGPSGAERVITYPVSANFFTTLGISPAIGRVFLPEEELTGHDGVAILSYGFWQRRYGGDPGVIGSSITLDGVPAEVVGVMPADFVMPVGYAYPAVTDVWFPLQRGAGYAQGRGNNNFGVIGRLRDGVSIAEAQAQMDVVARSIAQSYPEVKGGIGVALVPLHERFFGPARDALLVLAAIIALVPLVACANVASLFVARAVTRRTELACRLALGASRPRVVRLLLTEGLTVALAGAAVGLAIAFVGGEILSAFAPDVLPRVSGIAIDGTVLSVTLAAAFIMVPLFALAPAIRGTDMSVAEGLKIGGGRGASGRSSSLRSLLVVAQVALSLMLMLASGLFLRSFINLQRVDPGFQTERILSLNALLPYFKYQTRDEMKQVWAQVRRRVQAVPGVRTVGFVDNLPFAGQGPMYYVWSAEQPPASAAERIPAMRRAGSRGYFDALGIRLLAGSHFEETDSWFGAGGRTAVVVNETLARQFFPGEDPIGKTLVLDWDEPVDLEVIGLTADVRELGPASDPVATFYLPVRWDYDMLDVLLQTDVDPLTVVGPVRQAIAEVDRDITLSAVQTMQDRLSDVVFQPRFRSALVGAFALVTLVLSSIGLYGVLSYFVRERSHEISVRLALGAGIARVARLVLARGMALVAGGVLIGSIGALAGARLLDSVLFRVGPADPLVFGGVTLCLLAVALLACIVPMLRAVRLDPADVMKAE
jgi:putative ABC transport system permease protein